MLWRLLPPPSDYAETLAAMDALVNRLVADPQMEPEAWLLEHPPLYTAGTSAKADELLNPGDWPVYPSGRGGKYTWHGPGQRTVYVMQNLKVLQHDKPDLRAYVQGLEALVIDTLNRFGVVGYRRTGQIGVWVDRPAALGDQLVPAKIAAIGVRVRQWVTSHGIALNVHNDLAAYGGIIPCGIVGAGVTSLHDMGVTVSMDAVDEALKASWTAVFGS